MTHVDIIFLKFNFLLHSENFDFLAASKKYCMQTHIAKETNDEIKPKINTFTLVLDADV